VSLTADQLAFLASKGFTMEDVVEFARLSEIRHDPTAAERKRRQREKERDMSQRDVTRDILDKEVFPHTPIQEINPKTPPIVPPTDPVPAAVGEWNAMAEARGLAKVAKLTGRRRAAIRKRIDEFGHERWSRAVSAVGQSSFCCGDNDRGWRADIDFLASEAGFVKVIEGKFAPKARETSDAIRI
jgi:hypothetical protein